MRFETRYTYNFVKRSLPSKCQRILEVGCGTGELAAALSKDGYSVVAIDMDRDSIAAAEQLGVDARVARWPDFEDGHFDAVLFTRSLHHIHPLDESIRHLTDSLTEAGRVIVEDFAYESVDEKTLRWFARAIRLLESTESLTVNCDLLKKVLSKTKTLKAWRQNHENELHTATEIKAQLEKTLGRVVSENAAYYFRYVANAIPATDKRDAILRAFANEEETLYRNNSIVVLGRRFVAAAGG
jgi:SAM-dependent methyltransferase